MEPQPLKFGLIAETNAQLEDLTNLVNQAGHSIELAIKAAAADLSEVGGVDAWVVRLNPENEKSIVLMEALEAFGVPIIYDDAESYSQLGELERLNRFATKFQLCTGQSIPTPVVHKADKVWVLAASLGGPEAVCCFLKNMPNDISGIAFVYVQHIDQQATEVLVRALLNNTEWQVLRCERSQPILEKCIYIVPPAHQVDIHSTGVIAPLAKAWEGPFKPSIDQVIAKVARNYGKRSGVIVFSGMSNDGAQSCNYMRGSGGIVWAQSPDSCAIESMPVSAIATGAVSFQASPQDLAKEFVRTSEEPAE